MTPLATGPFGTEQELADDRTLLTARLIAAPPEQVYAAFVTPVRLARWWGPKGFAARSRCSIHGPAGRGGSCCTGRTARTIRTTPCSRR